VLRGDRGLIWVEKRELFAAAMSMRTAGRLRVAAGAAPAGWTGFGMIAPGP